MVFCATCGNKLPDGSRFCSSCGNSLPEGGAVGGPSATKSSGSSSSSSSSSSASPSRPTVSSSSSSAPRSADAALSPIVDELKRFYRSKILPLETAFKFDEFHSPSLTDTDFDAKPMVLLIGQYSTGKCFAKGTKMLMMDGNMKEIQNITEGEILMGDDNTGRVVQKGTVIHERSNMYTITPKGDSGEGQEKFTVNGDHILVLRVQRKAEIEKVNTSDYLIKQWELDGNNRLSFSSLHSPLYSTIHAAESEISSILSSPPLLWEISLVDFLSTPLSIQQSTTMYKPNEISFESNGEGWVKERIQMVMGREMAESESHVLLSAWAVGFTIMNREGNVIPNDFAMRQLEEWQSMVGNGSSISALLSSMGMGTKYDIRIPHGLKTDSLPVRRSFLSGIIDSIGQQSNANGNISLSFSSHPLSPSLLEDIKFVARSVGLSVGKVQHNEMTLSGKGLMTLPTLLSLSSSSPSKLYRSSLPQSTDLNSWSFDITPIGIDDYYGFTVDGNGRFLLSDFTVTHNTTFIKYMLERDFPGAHIGPEPTTDRFVAVMGGKDERIIPGNALAVDASKPFTALTKFGMAFLNKFECSQCDAKILDKITFIDTPGVLSGEKQRIGRSYNFSEVIEWFAERADRILLLFDAHKLDISDEFKTAIETLKGHDDKIRIVLNKADIDIQHLMRVYGALMWSLGKVIKTPEVLRVYIGSFSTEYEIRNVETLSLLKAEQMDLVADLRSLPRNSTVRKINELVKRARQCQVHAYIINHLRNQFGMFGKEGKQKKLLENLGEQFRLVQSQHNLPVGDFPSISRFREILTKFEIHKFPKLDAKMMKNMEDVLAFDIPNLMRIMPSAEEKMRSNEAAAHNLMNQPFNGNGAGGKSNGNGKGGDDDQSDNPFAITEIDAPVNSTWMVTRALKMKYDSEFYAMDLSADNKATGNQAKKVMLKTKLEPRILKQIWDLSDIDKDGMLDHEEFAVAMYLCDAIMEGKIETLPDELQDELIPPSRRKIQQ